MRWLRHNPVRRLQRDERGVTIAFFALLITAMLIIAALVIDIGALQAEKRELQNGADAAALALAIKCAEGVGFDECYDTPDSLANAELYANSNARDALSAVDGDPVYATDPDTGAPTVTVDTSTETNTGTVVPFSFAHILTGTDGQTVQASATVTWGALAASEVPSLAISYCDWFSLTANGTVYGDATYMYKMEDHRQPVGLPYFCDDASYPDPTVADPNGGFAWLEPPGSECLFEVEVGEWVNTYRDASIDPPVPCHGTGGKLDPLFDNPELIVAIYDLQQGGPGDESNPESVRIAGFASIDIVRYDFPPMFESQLGTCGPGNTTPGSHCIFGFLGALDVTTGTPGGGQDFGVTVPPRLVA